MRDYISLPSNEPASMITQTGGTGDHTLLSVSDVAKLLKMPISWVYGRVRKRSVDRIPGYRLGKYWRFREADVLAWLDRQRGG